MHAFTQFYINGEWVDPTQPNTLDVINPATEKAVGTISLGTEADVNAAVSAAKDAFATYSQTSVNERLELLQKILACYQEKLPQMAELISIEMGAPIKFAQVAQAPCGLGHIATTIEVLKRYSFKETVDNGLLIKEPIGVCGLITPWNWPINQVAAKVIPALAAGCTMVLKPSEIAPLDAYLFAEILHEAGVPKGVFNLVNGDGANVGNAISQHPDIDMVSFTGSTRAGIAVAKNASDTVKRVTQELGGKSANIILDDADFDTAVAKGVTQCFQNTGQSCNSPTRMLVPAGRLDEVSAIATAAASKITPGDPADDKTRMGPVSSEQQYKKIQQLIQAGIDEGATLLVGGTGKPEGLETGYFVKPTVFSNVNNTMTIAREEIFGPVLSIIPYNDTEQAIQIANDTPYGLSAYVSSSNDENALSVAAKLRAGNVHINNAPASFDMPFGGYKQSGNGREWGEAGLEEYLELKAVILNS